MRSRAAGVGVGVLGVALWLGALGCGGEETSPFYAKARGPGRGTEVGSCDITERACQQAVLDATLEVRGGELRLPEIYVITPEQFVEDLLAASDAQDLEPADAQWTRALSYFDLMPSRWSTDDDLDQLAEGVAAAYFHEGDYIVVLDHGGSTASTESAFTLSHELVHAMQDAQHNLMRIHEQFVEGSTDEYLGMLSLVEGEAILYSMLAVLDSPPETRAQWDEFFELYIAAVEDEALTGPAPYASASLIFPYAQGAEFVVDAYLSGGREAVDALYEDIPDSTRQILHPFDAPRPPGGWAPDLDPIDDGQVPDGFTVVAADELGAWLFEVFLARFELLERSPSLPRRLRGDRLVALSDGSATVGVWALRLDPADVESAAELFEALGSGFHVELRGEEQVLLLSGPPDVDLDAFAGELAWPPSGMAEAAASRSRFPPRTFAARGCVR